MAAPYQVAAYHHFENGFDDKLDYQTLEEAEAAAQGYVAGTMEEDGLPMTALPSMTPKHASASASTVITRTKRRRNRQQPLRWSMTPHSKIP